MRKIIHMHISCHKEEKREFIYKYKNKLLSLQEDKDDHGLDLKCMEGAPEHDIWERAWYCPGQGIIN